MRPLDATLRGSDESLSRDEIVSRQGRRLRRLLAAIHNVRIPEEDEILKAIEDERARRADEPEDDGAAGGPENEGGNYLM